MKGWLLVALLLVAGAAGCLGNGKASHASATQSWPTYPRPAIPFDARRRS